MKVLILSDTNRFHINYDKVHEREGKIDLLILLGDVEGGEYYIEATAGCPVHMVAGNNDFFSPLPKEEEFYIGNKKIFITHGHYFYVSRGLERLIAEGAKRNADIIMYGHTHRPALEHVDRRGGDNMLILNPGSISYPRQQNRRCTYMIMEINDENEVKVEIRYAD